MIEAAIFDFDGVIADSLDFVISVTNDYLIKRGKETVNREYFRSHEEVYKSYGLNFIQESILFWKIKSEIHRNLKKIPVHEHIIPTVKSLSVKTPLSVLTSNSKPNVLDFMKVHGIHNYFLEIHGNLLLLDKERGLSQILKRKKLNPSRTVYVGDEPRDMRTAMKLGVGAIAVDWGYSNRKLLEQVKPHFIASTSEELLESLLSA